MKNGLSENLVMIAELSIRPDKVDEFLDYTFENLAISRSYPGNIAFDILIDEGQADRVIFYEVWNSEAAQQAYMAWRTQAGDLTRLIALLAGPPRFTPLRALEDRRPAS